MENDATSQLVGLEPGVSRGLFAVQHICIYIYIHAITPYIQAVQPSNLHRQDSPPPRVPGGREHGLVRLVQPIDSDHNAKCIKVPFQMDSNGTHPDFQVSKSTGDLGEVTLSL